MWCFCWAGEEQPGEAHSPFTSPGLPSIPRVPGETSGASVKSSLSEP